MASIDRRVSANSKSIRPLLAAFSLLFVFTVLFSAFIGIVLINGNPWMGPTLFDASTTNLVLSIFSQLYAMLLGYVVNALLEAMRWHLASTPDQRGRPSLTFFQLGPGVGFFTLCFLTVATKLRNRAGLIK
jgi:hypothetical protein